MKKKLLLQDLAAAVAERTQTGRKETETFLRTFFNVVEQALLEDKFVKIKGLGTFKLVAVSERESVNISTGERFQISGHTKISFTPDNSMKELINRPFAHFEAVDLNDDTDPAEFEIIDREMEAESDEEADEDDDAATAVPATAASAAAASAVSSIGHTPTDTAETEAEEEAAATEPAAAVTEETTATPADEEAEAAGQADSPASETEVAAQPVAEAAAAEPETAVAEAETVIPEAETPASEAETSIQEAAAPAPETVTSAHEAVVPSTGTETAASETKTPAPQTEPAEEPHPVDEITPAAFAAATPDDGTDPAHGHTSTTTEYAYVEGPRKRRPNVWKIIAITLIVLILLAVSYFMGYYRLLCPCNYPVLERLTAPAPTAPASPAPRPAAPARQEPLKPLQPAANQHANDSAAAQKAATTQETAPGADNQGKSSASAPASTQTAAKKEPIPAYHTVKKGENIYRIARKYYGSDDPVPQIIKENKLKDANTITVGMKLTLPRQ